MTVLSSTRALSPKRHLEAMMRTVALLLLLLANAPAMLHLIGR